MVNVGYLRVSTTEQTAGLEHQRQTLLATGCTRLFSELVSSVVSRPELEAALDWVREGDTFTVTRLDRLARSVTDLLRIVSRLDEKRVVLRVLDFGGAALDTKGPTGRLILTMVGAISEFERALMLERQRAGIAAAKAEGRFKGRVPTARRQSSAVLKLNEEGVKPALISARLGISKASVYRILASSRSSGPQAQH